MGLPKIQTRVVHSFSKTAWNVVAVSLGAKYKIARVPYSFTEDSIIINEKEKIEAYEHAMFISSCFNAAFEEERKDQFKPFVPKDINPEDLPF